MDSLQGQLLVASPHLPDPNFYRSVVLLIHHDDEGAFGVILNRPTTNRLAEVWESVGQQAPGDVALHLGGPVPGPLLALHTVHLYSEMEVLPGLHLATQRDYLQRIIAKPDRRYRIFSGYAGWGAGQLEAELQVGGWLTTPASLDDVFDQPDQLWKKVSRRIGMDILAPSLKTKHLPEDPSVN